MSADPGAPHGAEQDHNPYAAPNPGPDRAGQPPTSYGATYGQAPAYGEAAAYGRAPTYGQPPSYGQATEYGQAPSYGQAPTYGQPPGYGQAPGHGEAPSYGQAPGHGQAPTYVSGGQPSPYGQVPSYGAPAYGYAAAEPGYGPPADWGAPRTDSMSIAALIVALSGFVVLVTFPVGLGLGIAGLIRTRRRHLDGKGLAIAGIVIGGLGTAFLVVGAVLLAVFAGSSDGFSDSGGSGTRAGSSGASGVSLPYYRLVQGLTPGECLDGDAGSLSLADAVPVACSTLHNLEVVSVYQLTERPADDTRDAGPGVTGVEALCERDVLAANSSLLGNDDWSAVYPPHPEQWDVGERSAYCLWGTDTSGIRGSATQGFGGNQGSGL